MKTDTFIVQNMDDYDDSDRHDANSEARSVSSIEM